MRAGGRRACVCGFVRVCMSMWSFVHGCMRAYCVGECLWVLVTGLIKMVAIYILLNFQHQRLDSVQVLLRAGSQVAMQSILIAIDVANPQVCRPR